MGKLPEKLGLKLQKRKEQNAFRALPSKGVSVDFSSNDYLGLSSRSIPNLSSNKPGVIESMHGATGSRLLTGNHELFDTLEDFLCKTYEVEAALTFNSGYDANLGFFSTVPQRGDLVLYDAYSHASIRDGISLGHAKSQKFAHNSLSDLEKNLAKQKELGDADNIFVVTESVFSMDGDSPDLEKMTEICALYNAFLVVDEAHALGVMGKGLSYTLGVQHLVFAKILTFSKGVGCHGAAIIGSRTLKEFLVNFCRSFIYTTALPPHTVAILLNNLRFMLSGEGKELKDNLIGNIDIFKREAMRLGLKHMFIPSNSAIQAMLISNPVKAKSISAILYDKGFDVKPILAPTVPQGQERLRFCIHSYNTQAQITQVLQLIKEFLNE